MKKKNILVNILSLVCHFIHFCRLKASALFALKNQCHLVNFTNVIKNISKCSLGDIYCTGICHQKHSGFLV